MRRPYNNGSWRFVAISVCCPASPQGLAGLVGGEGGEGGMVIELSPEDDAAIGRLAALGFDRNACLEAYLACDRNEEMAANYLAENMFD